VVGEIVRVDGFDRVECRYLTTALAAGEIADEPAHAIR
jgi:hypothetical protein